MLRHEKRPWGEFHVLEEGPGFKVKRIVVNPGGRLSLQSHQHRSEHWIVVQGKARASLEDGVVTLGIGQSLDIPALARHRLENFETTPLEVIEVLFGDYLEEDDIVRYEDAYNRVKVA